MLWLGLVVAALIAIDLAIRIPLLKLVRKLFETSPHLKVKEAAAVPTAERVSFRTRDGLTLRGALHMPAGPPRGVIVFCPEWHGNHWLARDYCPGLLRSNYAVLGFDFRNQGESDCQPHYAPLHWMTHYEVDDVLTAISYVATREELRHLPVGLMGVSRGGGAGLAAAAASPQVQAIVTDSAYSTDIMVDHYVERWQTIYTPGWYLRFVPAWHQSSIINLAKWISQRRRNCRFFNLEKVLPQLSDRPVLMIAGQRDSYIKPELTFRLADRIGGQCDVWLVPDARHNMARNVNCDEYNHRIAAFFDNHLREVSAAATHTGPTAAGSGPKAVAETRVTRPPDMQYAPRDAAAET